MGDNTFILYGKNSVAERLKVRPESIQKVYMQNGFYHPRINRLIKENDIECHKVTGKRLERIKHARDLQGILAFVDDFKYADINTLINKEDKPTLIFLDRITDPHNVGAIIRTAACFSGMALIIPRHQSCPVTEAVVHVASGGENFVPVALVSNLANALSKAKKAGYWLGGAVVDEKAEDITRYKLPRPLALVMGSEGSGIREGLLKMLDIKLGIPMEGAQISFNVSNACAIFCYEISKQKKTKPGT